MNLINRPTFKAVKVTSRTQLKLQLQRDQQQQEQHVKDQQARMQELVHSTDHNDLEADIFPYNSNISNEMILSTQQELYDGKNWNGNNLSILQPTLPEPAERYNKTDVITCDHLTLHDDYVNIGNATDSLQCMDDTDWISRMIPLNSRGMKVDVPQQVLQVHITRFFGKNMF